MENNPNTSTNKKANNPLLKNFSSTFEDFSSNAIILPAAEPPIIETKSEEGKWKILSKKII